MTTITSPLRYPGGKAKALKKLLPLIPKDFSEYREPFLGGGSIFLAIKKQHPSAIYKINDLNKDLYCFWVNLKNNADELINEIIRIKNSCKDGKKLYEEFASLDDISCDFARAVRFYILNRITYSGTVDSGGYSSQAFEKRFTLSNIEKLKPVSNLLQDVMISNVSYENLLFENGKEVFIYLDPPYWISKKSKLYGKNGDLHTSFNHTTFAKNVEKCKHKWLITYDDSEIIRKLFKFANIYPWKMQYGMNNVNQKKAEKGKEIILANYELNTKIDDLA